MDDELQEQIKLLKTKNKNKKEDLSEHYFIGTCLQIGLRIDDLKEMEYVDIAKIMISILPEDTKYRKATAEDWDKIM